MHARCRGRAYPARVTGEPAEPIEEAEPSLDGADEQRLPTRSRGGEIVGGILAGLEAAVTNRPTPPARIEEAYRDAWASLDGVTVDGLDEPPDRPERPDRSGARL
jgi:3-deoxy-D-arabino-heptulosonate 7-phosphate (DAHP) synthase class II